MKHQIELYSGLLKASLPAAASYYESEKAGEYVQETFTQIRNRLLSNPYLPDNSSADKQSDNDLGSDKVLDLLNKIADFVRQEIYGELTKRQLLPQRSSEKRFGETGYLFSDDICFEIVIVRSVYSYSLVQGFQTDFVGKAHATGWRCVDTVLPTGFDCLICRRHSRAGGNPDLGISGIFQDCCISNLSIFCVFSLRRWEWK